MDECKVIGLLCGSGKLPLEFASHIREYGFERLVTIPAKGYGSDELRELSDEYQELAITQLGAMIKYLKKHQVSKAVMLGRVEPSLAIANLKLDFRLMALAWKIKDRRADAILGAVADELKKDGIEMLDTTIHLRHLLATEGVMGRCKPNTKQMDDIQFGMKIALASGGLDIGQTAIVKKHAVIAVEAMEGTDQCIERAGKFGKGAVVVKMAKPNQDFRFDVPCFGPRTIENMAAANAAVLAVEAEKSFLIDKEETLALADRHGIAVVGVRRCECHPA